MDSVGFGKPANNFASVLRDVILPGNTTVPQRMSSFFSLRARLVGTVFVAIAPAWVLMYLIARHTGTELSWPGFVVGFLALVAAWLGGERFILRQVRSLSNATQKLAAGDMTSRTGLTREKGEFGETRVMVQGPHGAYAMVMVGKTVIISKDKFDSNPNSQAIVKQLIDLTIDHLYKKTSRDVKAKSMTVTEQQIIPSPVAIKFYISTLHITQQGLPLAVVGMHYGPFGKLYGIAFMMLSPVNPKAKTDNETFERVFNSFHLIGETPSTK